MPSENVSHLCVDGRWRKGSVKDCPKHRKIRKRDSVPGAEATGKDA